MNNSLGIVCCYFNPINYQSKYNNFIKFYDSLNSYHKDILVIELKHPSTSLSLPSHINSHIVYSDQILWHKENLLNIGIKKLIDKGYENIAWLDGDIIFDDSYWVEDCIESLRHYNLCQLFSRVYQSNKNQPNFNQGCVRYWRSTGNIIPISGTYHTGFAWAAKSSILKECLLYDKGLLGGADSLMWLASFYNSELSWFEIFKHHPLSRVLETDFLDNFYEWAMRWSQVVKSNVGHVFCPIVSLSHGATQNRKYISRYKGLIESGYNPNKDIYYKNGVIHTTNQTLHLKSIEYFQSRKEDKKTITEKISNKIEEFNNKNLLDKLDSDFLNKY
jgi:hypothetical protein